MEEKRSYYAIIPANVRYDKSLKPNAKLLYGEITALCNEKGYCWASNDYFSGLYEVSKETISRWVSQLKQKKYISVELEYREGTKEIIKRYLRICQEPIDKKVNTPIDKKVKENITVFNNTLNNTTVQAEPSLFDQIKDFFSRENVNYYHDGKQARAVKNIEKRFKEWEKVEPLFRRFKYMREHETFWSKVPLTAHDFYTSVDRILVWKEGKIETTGDEAVDWNLARQRERDKARADGVVQ
jgi:hypothetical protein